MHTVLEGFYGQTWSWQQRQFLIKLLAELPQLITELSGLVDSDIDSATACFEQYCYAPKSDKYLRQLWREPWPDSVYAELQSLAAFARANAVGFSVGLSPFSLFEFWLDDEVGAKLALAQKCSEISKLHLSSLGIFFDDMPASDVRVAAVQIEVVKYIQLQLPNLTLFFCPSYYSFDPILEELFGLMPDSYWDDLGQGLPNSIHVFWTGNQVISDCYDDDSLSYIASKLMRPVTIWDNSCVNDGRLTSDFLPLNACTALSDIEILENSYYFFLNPSNAFSIALITIISACFKGCAQERLTKAIGILPVDIQIFIGEYQDVFTQLGRAQCSSELMHEILVDIELAVTSSIGDFDILKGGGGEVKFQNKLAYALMVYLHQDVKAWVDEGFVFDPECLT